MDKIVLHLKKLKEFNEPDKDLNSDSWKEHYNQKMGLENLGRQKLNMPLKPLYLMSADLEFLLVSDFDHKTDRYEIGRLCKEFLETQEPYFADYYRKYLERQCFMRNRLKESEQQERKRLYDMEREWHKLSTQIPKQTIFDTKENIQLNPAYAEWRENLIKYRIKIGNAWRGYNAGGKALPHLYFFRHLKMEGVKAGRKFGQNYLYKYWKKACKSLNIQGVDLYGDTRHSSATALSEYLSPEQVKDATGHASKAFERYFQNKKGRVQKVTNQLKELQYSNQLLINIFGE